MLQVCRFLAAQQGLRTFCAGLGATGSSRSISTSASLHDAGAGQVRLCLGGGGGVWCAAEPCCIALMRAVWLAATHTQEHTLAGRTAFSEHMLPCAGGCTPGSHCGNLQVGPAEAAREQGAQASDTDYNATPQYPNKSPQDAGEAAMAASRAPHPSGAPRTALASLHAANCGSAVDSALP